MSEWIFGFVSGGFATGWILTLSQLLAVQRGKSTARRER